MNNPRWILRRRPVGAVASDDLALVDAPTPAPGEGEFLARTLYLSLDPAQRIAMGDRAQYAAPVQIGEVMRGMTLGVVEASNHPGFVPGDLVRGAGGWQAFWIGRDGHKVARDGLPLTAHLGVLGPTGASAYFGLLDVGRPKAGETVVVSAAAGAVGSIAGQIAKLSGCRVVGIAGSDEKRRYATEDLGFDACVSHRVGALAAALRDACPDGVDVAFENVGGAVLDAVLECINLRARVVLCGLIATYNAEGLAPGPYNFASVLMRRARVQGFIIGDYQARMDEFTRRMTRWLMDGRIRYDDHVVPGLENAREALGLLFSGGNRGKLMVEVSRLA
jgi:NADPH-dependent curcumin reductase CurA